MAHGATHAVDQRALAGAVRPNQAYTLFLGNGQFDRLQGHEAAEAFAQSRHFEQCVDGHARGRSAKGRRNRSRAPCSRPRIPLGAMMTNATSIRPTISKLSAEDIVTVATCCRVPRRIAPITGPSQLEVPPTKGIATPLTA